MKKGSICIGRVESLTFPNKGKVRVLEVEGEEIDLTQAVYAQVKNVLPEQKIRFRIQKKKHGDLLGQFIEVIEAADYECEKRCPHFGICGGCTYQTIEYAKQSEIKSNQIEALVSSVCDASLYSGITESPVETAYRNKMEFSFGNEEKDGPLRLGMHKRGSFYDVVNVSDCVLITEDTRKILNATYEYFAKYDISFYHKITHLGYLRHLLIRSAGNTGEILVDLVTSTQVDTFEDLMTEKELIDGWVKEILTLSFDGALKGILHTKNDRTADIVEDNGTEILYGGDFITETLLGLEFKITPFSFFQNNSKAAELLYSKAREFVLRGLDISEAEVYSVDKNELPVIYDLYSGTGTIAQILSPVAKEVIGVEIVEEASRAAAENAKLNNLDNCHFVAGDVLKVLDDIETKPDFIVLDPPRDGINPKALEKIINYGVKSIVYISCGPKSLVRDLKRLQEDYNIVEIHANDLFPGTSHVETVVLMSKV